LEDEISPKGLKTPKWRAKGKILGKLLGISVGTELVRPSLSGLTQGGMATLREGFKLGNLEAFNGYSGNRREKHGKKSEGA